MKRVIVIAAVLALLFGLPMSHLAFAGKGPPDGKRGESNVYQFTLETTNPDYPEAWGEATVKEFDDGTFEIHVTAHGLVPGVEYVVKSTAAVFGTDVANGGGNIQVKGTNTLKNASGFVNVRELDGNASVLKSVTPFP